MMRLILSKEWQVSPQTLIALAITLVVLSACAQRSDGDQEKSGAFYSGVSGGWTSR